MAFKATNILPDKGYEMAKQRAVDLKQFCTLRGTELSAGGDSSLVLGTLDALISYKTILNSVKAIPGMLEYAQAQENDPTYDAPAEFIVLLGLIDSAITAITVTFPVDASGYLLADTFNPDGTRSYRSFSGANLSGLRTELANIAAGIS